MQITTSYILSQIIIVFVYMFLGLTYCVKNRKIILLFSFSSNFLNAIAFVLLGANTSAFMCGISIFRDIIFLIDEKINGKSLETTIKDWALLILIYSISIVAIVLTFKGFLTLIYAVGSMIYTYSIWQKNNKMYKLLGIVATAIVIFDSIYIKSISGVILQSIVLICSCVGYFSHKEEKSISYEIYEQIELSKAG